MSEYIYAGSTSQSIDWMIYDSSSTIGAGLTGLLYNSSGLKAYYRIGATGAATAITLATQTPTGAWSSGGFVEIDATNMKGTYRLDLPNAVSASNSLVTLYLYGAANMMPSVLRIDCRALPVDLKLIAGQTANAAAAVTFPATLASTTNITSATGIVPATGAITNAQAATIPTSGTITTGTNQTGDSYAYLSTNMGLLGANLSGVPKIGYKLASDGLASVTAWTVGLTGNITGNLSGSVGSVTSAIVLPTAPTDWITAASVSAAAVTEIQSGLSTYAGGDTSGTTTLLTRIAGVIPTNPLLTTDSRLNNLDATVSSRLAAVSYTAPPSSSDNANAVWQSLTTTNWGANSFGNYVIISNNTNRSIGITGAGSGHVQCDVHEMQPDVLTASALATDAVTEIWAASSRTLTAFAFTPTVGGYAAGQDPATLLLVNGPTNKLQVNSDNSVNATATVDVNAVATAVANIMFVDGATNQLKVNTDHTVNATVSGTIVNYVTIPSAVAQASILAAQITAVRGDTLTVALPIMGSLVGRTELVFTVKKSVSDLDSEAILQVSESGGLVILNGSSTVIGTAQLSVTNATTGAVNLTLSAATTATIPLFDYLWDCQKVLSSGVSTPINGVLSVTGDVTRRTI